MPDFIGIDLSREKIVQIKIKEFGDTLGSDGVESATKYIVEFERIYPGSRKGESFIWSSEKQRKAFFASNGFGGGIPYTRTEDLRWGWKVVGSGLNAKAVNIEPYAKWVKQDGFQQIGLRARGWTTTKEDIKDRSKRILESFMKGVREAKKKVGL